MAWLKNILLVYPKVPSNTYWSFKYALPFIHKKSTMPPLGLITVSSLIPDGYNLKLVDLNIEHLHERDIAWADAVFLSSMIVQKASFENVVRLCNRFSKPVIAGGPYPTSSPQQMTNVDHIVVGEAEALISPLLNDLQKRRAQSIYRCTKRPDLTRTVVPRFDLLKMEAYADMAIQYSRGCPFTCEFCDIWPMYGNKPRLKSASHFVAELDTLYRLGWQGPIFIVDDNFIGNRNRVKRELLPALESWQKRHGYVFRFFTEASINLANDDELLDGMKNAGFTEVFIGIETVSPESLKETGKEQNVKVNMEKAVAKIQRHGLAVMAGFILGFDNDTEEVFDEQISFIQKTGIPKAMVGLLTALPGTKLYERLLAEGRLIRETIGNNTHSLTTNFITKMNSANLKEGYKEILATIYDTNLKNYFARCNRLLDNLGPSDYFQRDIHFAEVRTFFTSLFRQPFTPYGFQYLKFISRNFLKHRDTFAEAITFSVMGHHFYTITRHMLKVEKISTALEERYTYLRDQLNQHSQATVYNSRKAVRQAQKLWKQRKKSLAKLRRKIDDVPVDFREDIYRYYLHICEKTNDLFRRFEEDLARYGYGL